MNLPKFTAADSLYQSTGRYRHGPSAIPRDGTVVPALPFCENCDEILDRCAQNGGYPSAVCRACARGACYSGVERPPGWENLTPP
jgi:hypothetical protein